MASLTIRKLDDAIRDELRLRAARNGRSVEDEVRTILTGIRRSARAGVRLRLLEELLDHDTLPSPEQAWSDAVMMILYQGGHERTESDYRSLLTESGWRVVDVFIGLPGLSVLDAVAV